MNIPELSLVVLVGVSGSGKSTFAARHFRPTEVISSDFCRGLVADDENDQSRDPPMRSTVLNFIAGLRLAAAPLHRGGRDQRAARGPEARSSHSPRNTTCLRSAIVFDVPEAICISERNTVTRPDRELRPARRPPPATSPAAEAHCSGPSNAKASGPCIVLRSPSRRSTRPADAPRDQDVDRPARADRGPFRRRSATSTGASPSSTELLHTSGI